MKTAALLLIGSAAGAYAFATGDFVTPWVICGAVIALDHVNMKEGGKNGRLAAHGDARSLQYGRVYYQNRIIQYF